jgi:hypothetical protein
MDELSWDGDSVFPSLDCSGAETPTAYSPWTPFPTSLAPSDRRAPRSYRIGEPASPRIRGLPRGPGGPGAGRIYLLFHSRHGLTMAIAHGKAQFWRQSRVASGPVLPPFGPWTQNRRVRNGDARARARAGRRYAHSSRVTIQIKKNIMGWKVPGGLRGTKRTQAVQHRSICYCC